MRPISSPLKNFKPLSPAPTLKYLAVIESDLKSNALSSAGAVGPWQLMPGTARDLGLTVAKGRDDRTDLSKSTHAAARFLSILYKQLGDWLLVVAAYNGGPARLDKIIKRNDNKNFWDIQQELPAESRNHVKNSLLRIIFLKGRAVRLLENCQMNRARSLERKSSTTWTASPSMEDTQEKSSLTCLASIEKILKMESPFQ